MKKQILANQCIPMLLEIEPGFQESWNSYLEFWGDEIEKSGLCNELSEFSSYLAEKIKNKDLKNLKEIFDLIERFVCEGDDQVVNATITCLLENLQNSVSHRHISGKEFAHFLGPKSMEYCLELDQFWGVQTEGFYKG